MAFAELKPGSWRGEDEWYNGAGYNYESLVQTTGVTVVAIESEDDYQGDSLLHVTEGGRHGLLVFGWGSCSGCDALEACDTPAELEQLRTELYGQINWFDTAEQFRDHVLNGKDWEGDWVDNELVARFKRAITEEK